MIWPTQALKQVNKMSHVTSTQKLLLKSQMETNVSLTIPDLAQTTEKTFQLPSNQAITKYHAKTPTIWVINSLHTNYHFSSLRFDSLAPSLRLHQKSIIWSCNWQPYWFLTGRPTGTQRLLISLDYNLQGWGWKFTSKGSKQKPTPNVESATWGLHFWPLLL